MIILCGLKLLQFVSKIAAIEWLFPLTSKQIGAISSQPKFNQTYSDGMDTALS